MLFFILYVPPPRATHTHTPIPSLSVLFIALIYFSAYEWMLLPSKSNFLTPALLPAVSVPPAGDGESVVGGGKNKEEA